MAIKFRRIEDRRESMVQLRRREADRQVRRRILPKLVIVAVVLVAIVIYFAYFRPPRIVAPFMVNVDAVQVSSPLAGTLDWVIAKDVAEIREGDVIARIAARPETSDSAAARLTDLRVRQVGATAQLYAEQAGRAVIEGQLQDEERHLRVEVERLKESLKRSETGLEESRRELQEREEDLKAAEALRSITAITKDDYLAAKRSQEGAQAGYESAQSSLRSVKAELSAAEESLNAFSATSKSSLAQADSRIRGAGETCDALSRPIESQMAAFSQDGSEFIVRAPTSGLLLELNVSEKSYVNAGEPLLRLYDPATKVARAYVPVRYRDGLRKGGQVRLYASGYKHEMAGEVTYVDEHVVPLPSSLAHRVGYAEANAIPVDIRLTGLATAELLPGDTGKAVIEK